MKRFFVTSFVLALMGFATTSGTSIAQANANLGHIGCETLSDITARLDLLSFPNSFGPQGLSGEVTLESLGYQLIGGCQSAVHWQHDWMVALTPIVQHDFNGDGQAELLFLFEDRALNGGTYSVSAYYIFFADGAVLPVSNALLTHRRP